MNASYALCTTVTLAHHKKFTHFKFLSKLALSQVRVYFRVPLLLTPVFEILLGYFGHGTEDKGLFRNLSVHDNKKIKNY